MPIFFHNADHLAQAK